jgi:hypothetical protein
VRRRRRSTALREAAGVYHVASRLTYEGFRATVAQRSGVTGVDVLARLPGAPATAALQVRTTVCLPEYGGGEGICEWRVGKGAALAEEPGLFVALVDLGRGEDLPGVWIVPSFTMRQHFASPEGPRLWRYRASAGELAPYRDGWDAVEDHLLGERPSQRGWIVREQLEERYGEEFVGALDTEVTRLLGAHNSTIHKMADERFPAEELAEASALLSVLFRRWMEAERKRRRQERRDARP